MCHSRKLKDLEARGALYVCASLAPISESKILRNGFWEMLSGAGFKIEVFSTENEGC